MHHHSDKNHSARIGMFDHAYHVCNYTAFYHTLLSSRTGNDESYSLKYPDVLRPNQLYQTGQHRGYLGTCLHPDKPLLSTKKGNAWKQILPENACREYTYRKQDHTFLAAREYNSEFYNPDMQVYNQLCQKVPHRVYKRMSYH